MVRPGEPDSEVLVGTSESEVQIESLGSLVRGVTSKVIRFCGVTIRSEVPEFEVRVRSPGSTVRVGHKSVEDI